MNNSPVNFGFQPAVKAQPVKKQSTAMEKDFSSLLDQKLENNGAYQKNVKDNPKVKESIPPATTKEKKSVEDDEALEVVETSLEDIMKLFDRIVNIMMHMSAKQDHLDTETMQVLQTDLLQSMTDLKLLLDEVNQNHVDLLNNLSPQLQDILKLKAEDFMNALNKLTFIGDTAFDNLDEAEMSSQLTYLSQGIEKVFGLKDAKPAVNMLSDMSSNNADTFPALDNESIPNNSKVEDQGLMKALRDEETKHVQPKESKFEFVMPKAMNDFSGDKFAQELFASTNDQNSLADFISAVKSDHAAVTKPDFFNILEQVSEKVRVLVNDDVSEMQLQLKPDNLGKLSMKISIERGIVIAEFVAESRIVKEILESNMNLLKDALNQKGLSVNELNVTVGDQSNFEDHQNLMSFGKKKGSRKVSQIDAAFDEEADMMQQAAAKSMNSTAVDSLG